MIALGKLIGAVLGSEPAAAPVSGGPERTFKSPLLAYCMRYIVLHQLTRLPHSLSFYSVVVVGSCNMDQIAYIPRFPGAGETIHGSKYLVSARAVNNIYA